MAANYRYWCGECGYRTPWLTESEGAGRQEIHYAQRHRGVAPGGRVEVRRQAEGRGCLLVVGVLFLVLLLASTCRGESRSAPPAVPGPAMTLTR